MMTSQRRDSRASVRSEFGRVPHATSGEGSAVTRTTQHKKWFEEIAHVFNRHAIILSA